MLYKRVLNGVIAAGMMGAVTASGLSAFTPSAVSAESHVDMSIMSETLLDTNKVKYMVTVHNMSDTQVLAPGAYAVHDSGVSLNFDGQISPASFEGLSEIGSNEAFVAFLESVPSVKQVVRVDMPIMPGQSYSFEVSVPHGYLLSGLQMPVGTNDGLALVDAVPLNGTEMHVDANNYDNGTEENSPLLSGFDGGQPDPSRGAENVENGVATDPQEAFAAHPQLTETVLRVHVLPAVHDMPDQMPPIDDEHSAPTPVVRDYTVTINNVSDTQVLAPGFYAVHDSSASLNFSGVLSPAAFESLSEIGSPAAAAALVETLPGVMHVVVMDAPVMPGESTHFVVSVPDGYLLSGLQMPVGTNDGLALVDAIELSGVEVVVNANNYDNGTEENSPLLSGFDGGQPDPSRGAENVENGVATDPQEVFVAHPELTETVLQAVVTPEVPIAVEVPVEVAAPMCSFTAYDRNNRSYAITDGHTVPVHTNVGLTINGDNLVSYDWYVDYDGDRAENAKQHNVSGDNWSYTVWAAGQFDYSAMVTDMYGETTSCSITVHAQ